MIECRIGASAIIGGATLGSEGLSRSSAAFITALRDRFAKGDLTVTVDPDVQVQAVTGQFFVRSEWKEPDRTTPIDLLLRELDGRWQWTSAIHYYPSMVGSGCIPYRSPWVTEAHGRAECPPGPDRRVLGVSSRCVSFPGTNTPCERHPNGRGDLLRTRKVRRCLRDDERGSPDQQGECDLRAECTRTCASEDRLD